MKKPSDPNRLTGLTWAQVVATLNLFFLPLIGDKSRENILKEMQRLDLKMGEVIFFTYFFPHRRGISFKPQPTSCPGITFNVEGKGQGCWYMLRPQDTSEIRITDRPEKDSGSSTTITVNKSGATWTMVIDARHNADPKYKAAFDALKNSRQAA